MQRLSIYTMLHGKHSTHNSTKDKRLKQHDRNSLEVERERKTSANSYKIQTVTVTERSMKGRKRHAVRYIMQQRNGRRAGWRSESHQHRSLSLGARPSPQSLSEPLGSRASRDSTARSRNIAFRGRVRHGRRHQHHAKHLFHACGNGSVLDMHHCVRALALSHAERAPDSSIRKSKSSPSFDGLIRAVSAGATHREHATHTTVNARGGAATKHTAPPPTVPPPPARIYWAPWCAARMVHGLACVIC